MPLVRKVMIVEGATDRERLLQVLREPVDILCTGGTLSYEKVEARIAPLYTADCEVYILVDADEPGQKLRNQLRQELPRATHLYTRRMYREVASTPLDVLASILDAAHFAVDETWLQVAQRPQRRDGSRGVGGGDHRRR
ncbi:MAG: toprim domain-containing protein [Alicyclobacillus sp.]|nr:toprim domain-containing protein [Alicyclobacillus sp.]